MANFAIISAGDNKALGGVAPSEYKLKMPAAKLSLILSRALCSEVLFTDRYENFIDARAARLVEAARAVMGVKGSEKDSNEPSLLRQVGKVPG